MTMASLMNEWCKLVNKIPWIGEGACLICECRVSDPGVISPSHPVECSITTLLGITW